MRRTRSFSGKFVRLDRFRSLNSVGNFNIVKKSLGDWSSGETPGNIPNPAVKPASADGTWGATPWESRSLPRDFFVLIINHEFSLIDANMLLGVIDVS